MHDSETRAAILATLDPTEARLVEYAWQRSILVRYLVAHRKRSLLRHTWRHPSFLWALLHFCWIDWRLSRSLRVRVKRSGTGNGTTRVS